MSGIPQRSGTVMTKASTMSTGSEEDAIPDEDTSEVTRLFAERLQAWKHACGYLEDYIAATEKLHREQSNQYEKVLKTVSQPLKEGHHFEQNLGGVAGFMDNVRQNTQAMAQSYSDTAKVLKSSVLPTFARLHQEIKNKSKELVKGAGKGSKVVDKARNATQKHIELLGSYAATYDSTGGKLAAEMDPYLLYRGTMHRLNRQILEENANRQDIISVQNNFASFESHVVQTIQQGLGQLNSVITKQADATKSYYGDMVATGQRIPPDFEWMNFLHRNQGVLIDPDAPERNIENVSFPNQNHRSTIPLISGMLERRGKMLRRWDPYYYAVTASKYLHEFKTDDDFAKDPIPEMSLFLPDCVVGQVEGDRFTIKGKDMSKGPLGMTVHTTHEFNFKAHTTDDAERWWEIIRAAAGQVTNSPPAMLSSPTSPVVGHTAEGAAFGGVKPDDAAMREAEQAEAAHAAGGITALDHAPQAPATQNPDALPIREGRDITPTGQTTGTTGVATIPASHLPRSENINPPTASSAAAPAPTAPGAVTTSAGPKEGVSIANLPAKS